MKLSWGGILLASLLSLRLLAQGAEDLVKRSLPSIQAYTEREGLPHATVHAMSFDAQGRLWVGTPDGPAWFDGRVWTPFPMPKLCRSKYIRALVHTPDGATWFGTQEDGLWQLKDDQWIHHDGARGLPARRINHLAWVGTPDGYDLWAATADAGVARFAKGTWRTWSTPEGLRNPWVWRIRVGLDRVWVAGIGGIGWIQGDALAQPTAEYNHLGKEANDILDGRDSTGNRELWATFFGAGIAAWREGRWVFQGPETGFGSQHPVVMGRTLEADGTPVLWVGTYDKGLFLRRGQAAFEGFTPRGGFPVAGVYELLVSPQTRPTLWAASRSGGLLSIDLAGWSRMDTRQGLPPEKILAIAAEGAKGEGPLWFGTEQGVFHAEGPRWALDDVEHGFPSTMVNALAWSRAFGGRMVAGTLNGLAVREGKVWKLIAGKGVLPAAQVACLLERDEDGAPALWAGIEGGLARYHRGTWTTYTTRNGLPNDWVYALATSTSVEGVQSLWIGTRGGGVARLKAGRWTYYGADSGLSSLSVYALLVQTLPNGRTRLWAGTYGGGLAWIDPDDPSARWAALTTTTTPALPSDVIVQLQEDPRGRLYLGTTQGVARLEGPTGTDPGPLWRITAFSEGDGLPSRLCNMAASYMDAQGRFWSGTAQGLGIFDPAKEVPFPELGSPKFTGAWIGARWIQPTGSLQVGPKQGALTLEYTLPLFIRADGLRFQTQLLGLEDQPTPWTPQSKRELAGMRAGSYVLRVWAKDHLGRVTQPLDIPFRIKPHPLASPLAFMLYVLTLGGLAWAAYRLRVGWLERRTRDLEERVRIATADLHAYTQELVASNARLMVQDETKSRMLGVVAHDLRNPLGAVSLYSEFLEGPGVSPEEVTDIAGKIRKSVAYMGDLLKRFLDLEAIEGGRLELNLKLLSPGPLLHRIQEAHRAHAGEKGIPLQVEAAPDLPALVADPVFLQAVLDNLVSNALKFTPPGPPERPVHLVAGHGWIEVRDQGPGFTSEDQAKAFGQFVRLSARPTAGESSTGLGLAIVKALMETMGGTVTLESEAGRGATFRISLPIAGAEGLKLPFQGSE